MSDRSLRLSVPALSARVEPSVTLSTVARLIASGRATTKADLTRSTGLARSTVALCVDVLLEAGVVHLAGAVPSTGRGRPAEGLALSWGFGRVLVADIGARASRLRVGDLGQGGRGDSTLALDVRDGPDAVLDGVCSELDRLLLEAGPAAGPARVLVVGLPGPVDARAGTPVRPPIMPGWDGYPVSQRLAERFGCAVLLENDVNLRALGEARALPADQSPLLFVKVGTGVGGGIVMADGQLHHGADGSAGDVGHVRTRGGPDVMCGCGNVGCVEAVASATAILRDLASELRAAGLPDSVIPAEVSDLEGLLRQRDPAAVRLVREASAVIGEVVAMLVHFYNPARVALGGAITAASDDLLAGVRSVVYQSALPLATRNLVVAHSVLGEDAGLAGGVVLGVEHALSPAALHELVPGLANPAVGRRS